MGNDVKQIPNMGILIFPKSRLISALNAGIPSGINIANYDSSFKKLIISIDHQSLKRVLFKI